MIKVSILVPVFKTEKYVRQCFSSLFGQTYENIEYVIVNDASPDNSMSVIRDTLKDFPHRKNNVHIIENENNCGIAKTRNLLLRNATGDYVYFVDSDDFLDTIAVDIFVKAALDNKADIIRCNYNYYSDGKVKAEIRKPLERHEDLFSDCLKDGKMRTLWLLFVRRNVFENNNLCFSEKVNGCEDFLMTIKLFYYADKIVDIPQTLYNYRLDNIQSITHQEQTFSENQILALKEIEKFLKMKGIYSQYESYLQRLKFIAKQPFLLNKSVRDFEKYIQTFPESSHCYRYYHYDLKQSLLFFLAEHKCKQILRLFARGIETDA